MSCELGIIGVGAMGSALLRGIVGSGLLAPSSIIVYDVIHAKTQAVSEELGCLAAKDLSEIPQKARRILLAVKPAYVADVLKGCADSMHESHVIISIAAGVSIQRIQAVVPAGCGVVRAMPNTPALIGQGVTAVSFSDEVKDYDRDWTKNVLNCVGSVVEVPEAQMDAVTALSGSGPAYVYLFLESMIDGGVAAGLPRQVAETLAMRTVMGAAAMAMEAGKHPAELRAEVTSPDGTTVAGMRVLEKERVRSALIEAIMAARNRSEELGRQS